MHPHSIYVLNIKNFLGFQKLKEDSEPVEKPNFLKRHSGQKSFSRNFLPKSRFNFGSNKYFSDLDILILFPPL